MEISTRPVSGIQSLFDFAAKEKKTSVLTFNTDVLRKLYDMKCPAIHASVVVWTRFSQTGLKITLKGARGMGLAKAGAKFRVTLR